MLRTVLTVLQVFVSLGIVGLVLLQRGKGADAGAGFGAGASGTVFGARGATTALSRATAILAAIFMVNSLALAYMGSRTPQAAPSTIFDQAGESVPAPSGAQAPVTPAPQDAVPAPAAPAPENTDVPQPAN